MTWFLWRLLLRTLRRVVITGFIFRIVTLVITAGIVITFRIVIVPIIGS